MSRSHDRAKIVRLYQDGMHINEIAAVIGCHRSAVYRHLDAAGVQRRDDRLDAPGRPKLTHCQRGHEFTPENTRLSKDGKRRSCKACQDWNKAWREALKTLELTVSSEED